MEWLKKSVCYGIKGTTGTKGNQDGFFIDKADSPS